MSSRALLARPGGGFAPDRRFRAGLARAVAEQAEPAQGPPEPEPDLLAEAFARGHAEGEAAAERAAEQRLAEIAARYAGLERAFADAGRVEEARLRERLRDTVAALCEASLLPHALDPELLAARVERAAAMLLRAADQRRVRLHPDDLALVRPLVQGTLALDPDPSLARGSLRIETADGGIEDGPDTWREAIAEALGAC